MSKGSERRTFSKEADDKLRKNKFYDDCEFELKKRDKKGVNNGL